MRTTPGTALTALTRTSVEQMLERDGADAVGNSRVEVRKFLRNEVDKWSKAVKEKNLLTQ